MNSKKVLFNITVGASLLAGQVLAEENSGWYATGSIGASQILDIDYINADGTLTGNKVTFDSGLGLDIGVGYDFGSTRLEGTWSRGQSPGGTDRGTVFVTDTTIDSILLSAFYDFRSSKQWSPFVGISVGSTRVDHLNVDDTGTSYGIGFGLSYKTSDTTEVFYKSTAIVTPELDTLSITNGVYGNGTIGVRFIF
tara:strand:- start:1530 stop:2114 length:585 start_codon:yes stop_codon:yes gene_type:complete